MLQARGLTKHYGSVTALDRLDLDVAAGEVFCLLGANGAGKTTTINLFLGFVQASAGEARIDGIAVEEEPLKTKQRLAYVPEQVALYGGRSGLENLAFFAELAGRGRLPRAALLRLLAEAGLGEDVADRRLAHYSKGMRQKVAIAIALAKRAKVLLLDEPTSGLDPKASNDFSTLLLQLSRSGMAVLMATHDLFRAKETATRIGIMRSGRLVRTLAAVDIGHGDLERVYLETMAD